MKGKIVGVIAIVFIFALDQVSKAYAIDWYSKSGGTQVFKFCDLVEVWNRGISFGMFGAMESSNLIFTYVSLGVILALFVLLLQAKHKKSTFCMGVVIGGALGNLADRLRFGAVYDFISLHVGELYWPAFNIADACVTCGVIGFLCLEVMYHAKARVAESADPVALSVKKY
ncbi:lipoprotein signal peptidase [Anaplasma centrale str. Israel]|uniref:Lipoprotein signal peptidase n=1 Tax=Anaplasma centrale (strain Israel) TaxID=574556 RepID=D1ATS2_ANACI|nr:signal peptidase II [Anaplasma centrale]ACZ48950.1 lipoprotein signal peptidase [Anaplasma centrale str. Israel]